MGPNVQGANLGLGANGVLFAKNVLEGLSQDGFVEDEGADLLRLCNQDTHLHLCRDHLATFRVVEAAHVSLGEGGTGFAKVNSLWRKGLGEAVHGMQAGPVVGGCCNKGHSFLKFAVIRLIEFTLELQVAYRGQREVRTEGKLWLSS